MSSKTRLQQAFPVAFALFFVLFLASIMVFILRPPSINTPSLEDLMEDILSREDLQSTIIGISVQYEGDTVPIYENESEILIHPGSNYKLLTTAAVLETLGTKYKYETNFFEIGSDIVLRGSGDPSLTRADLEIAAETLEKNYSRVLYDESTFSGEKYGPEWKKDWYEDHYAIPMSALNINDNLLSITVETEEEEEEINYSTYPLIGYEPIIDEIEYKEEANDIQTGVITIIEENGKVRLTGDYVKNWAFSTSGTIKDPAKLTARVLGQILNNINNIKPFTGQYSLDSKEPTYVHYSSSASDLIYEMLKFSRNHYAESFIRALGEEVDKESNLGSQEKGVNALEEFLVNAGLSEDQMELFDGSGLSPKNRISTKNMMALLSYASEQAWTEDFWGALPQAGIDGTLIRRFKDLPVKGNVLAKTGTHENSNSLSGKIMKTNTPDILFSIHFYGHPYTTQESVKNIVPLIDQIVFAIDNEY